MPWQEVTVVSQRKEFVGLALAEGANVRELCRRFGISHAAGYKWLRRYRHSGESGLLDQSRRPLHSPARTPPEVEHALLEARSAHPSWGARKLRRWLLDRKDMLEADMPAPSTITAILRRNGRVDPVEAAKRRPYTRFEHESPNLLWQMDFKGHFPLTSGGRCHPLTVLDDHSRFALGLEACGDEQSRTVQRRLTSIFRTYGLPNRMLMDNGPPWGSDLIHTHTSFTVWLMKLGVGVSHGRPYHPQTQGKDERFHRTFQAEVLQGHSFSDLGYCQRRFSPWRDVYNLERPHQALDFATPASRYQISVRPFPEAPPPIEYGPDDHVRRVQDHGVISFQGKPYRVGKAFRSLPVAVRTTAVNGFWDVFFLSHKIAEIDQNEDPLTTNNV